MKTSMSRSTFKILFYVKKGSERANGYLPLTGTRCPGIERHHDIAEQRTSAPLDGEGMGTGARKGQLRPQPGTSELRDRVRQGPSRRQKPQYS